MTLWMRGAIWFALYVAIALLPLAVAAGTAPFAVARPAAVEFSVALGFIAFALILVQFALVSRLRASSRPFGTDALTQFHQQIGVALLVFVVAHPLLLAPHGVGAAA